MLRIILRLLERIGVVVPEHVETYQEQEKRSWQSYPLQDRRGRSYVFVVDEENPFGSRMWVLPAEDKKRKKGSAAFVGYVEVVHERSDPIDTITLADIRILDPADRHHGLGTAMLRMLLGLLREPGVRYVHGFVTPEDQAATPGLVEWYRREGFEVSLGTTERRAMLSIDLDRAEA